MAWQPRRRDLNGQRALTAVRVLLMRSTVQRPGGVRRSRERPRPEHGWCAAPLIIFPDEVGQRAAAQLSGAAEATSAGVRGEIMLR